MRSTGTALRAFVLGAALALACGAAGRAAPAAGAASAHAQAAGDFTHQRVTACLRRARSSLGTVLVGTNPYLRNRFRARALLQLTLLHTDYGLPGVNIVFASRMSDVPRLRRAVVAYETEMGGASYARTVVFRRRANVLFYYDPSTPSEIVRIANGCLGGPPYRGDGGTPPPSGFPG